MLWLVSLPSRSSCADFRSATIDTTLATQRSVVREYSKDIPVIQNLDFVHTDPRIVLPKGNRVRINNNQKRIFLTY